MSLMDYGFTKLKPKSSDEECEVLFEKRPEIVVTMSGGSPSKKMTQKSPPKSSKTSNDSSPNNSSSLASSKISKSSITPSSPKKLTNSNSTNSANKKITSSPKSNKNTPQKSTPSTTPKSKVMKENINKLNQCEPMDVDMGSPPSSKKSGDSSLPYHRIKIIMKTSPDVDSVHNDTVHLVSKATELFIQHLCNASIKHSSYSGTLDYDCLSEAVHDINSLEFLKETIPKKITWEECQKLMAAKKT